MSIVPAASGDEESLDYACKAKDLAIEHGRLVKPVDFMHAEIVQR